jgi:type IV secretory pathway VirB2 component (pilin)
MKGETTILIVAIVGILAVLYFANQQTASTDGTFSLQNLNPINWLLQPVTNEVNTVLVVVVVGIVIIIGFLAFGKNDILKNVGFTV